VRTMPRASWTGKYSAAAPAMSCGAAEGYRMPDRCYALEYARGLIPAMLPFAMADTLTSTLDLRTLARTLRLYGKAVVRELLQGKV
jgi:C-8 sterol isomerase